MQEQDTEPGYCRCGCGEWVGFATRTDRNRGYVKGDPMRWVPGHSTRLSPYEYLVDVATGCWVWQRATLPNGYGYIRRNYRSEMAHRFIYRREVGEIPEGLDLDHMCKNRRCVNPAHLEPVTHAENQRRGSHAKLTMEKAREIRASADDRHVLAARYGVSPATIWHVLQNRSWREDQ